MNNGMSSPLFLTASEWVKRKCRLFENAGAYSPKQSLSSIYVLPKVISNFSCIIYLQAEPV